MIGTVLVTGGAGFIGAYVTRRLLADSWRVVVFDAHPSGNVLTILMPDAAVTGEIVIESGAITDGSLILELCRRHRIEAAVHLASPLTQDVTARPMEGIRDICMGTAAVFAAAHEAGLRRVVWASSVAVFGAKSGYPPGPLANDACHRPPSLYGSCKSLCETLSRRAFEVDGLDVVGLRLSVVYGAGRLRGYMSYPSHLMRSAAAREAVHIPWSRQRLHWQYVEEVADMAAMALASNRPGAGRSFNTPGDCRSWGEVAEVLRLVRPALEVTVADEVDPALADVAEDYDASAFSDYYGYALHWPVEKAVPDTLGAYERMTHPDSQPAGRGELTGGRPRV
jgi:nucleoside-diphosphate-sugar epimerase